MTMAIIGKGVAAIIVRTSRLLAWLYYSTIRISGRERIPKSGPVLFVANHANSIFDPIVLELTVRRKIRFLAKATLFKLPVFGSILHWLGMIPVHRAKDDKSAVKKSIESLRLAAVALADNEAVGIFPEGKCHDNRSLESVFAGTARIILQALEAGSEELKIVPIGINYDNKQLFRSAVWVQVGEPLDARAFVDAQGGGGAAARRALTVEIGERLKRVIIHLDAPEWEPFLEDLEILDPALEASEGHAIFSLRQRKVVADSVNHFRKTRPESVSSLGRALSVHRMKLNAQGLQVRSDILQHRGWRRFPRLLLNTIRLAFGFLPLVAGTLQNGVPFLIERAIVRFLPHSGLSTIALSRIAIGFPVFLLWYGLVWWWMSIYFLPWVAWGWALATPFAGLFALGHWRSAREVARSWWIEIRMLFNRRSLAKLRAMQDKLHGRIRVLSDAYADSRPTIEPKRIPLYKRPALRHAVIWMGFAGIGAFVVVAALRVGFQKHTLAELTMPAFDFRELAAKDLDLTLNQDELMLLGVLATLRDFETRVRAIRGEFDAGQRLFTSDSDTDLIRQHMLTYLNCRNELLWFIWKYRESGVIADPSSRRRAKLLGLTAGCTLYQYSSKFVRMFDDSPLARKKLNESEIAWEIPAGIYDTIRDNLEDRTNLETLKQALVNYLADNLPDEKTGIDADRTRLTFRTLIESTSVATPGGTPLTLGALLEEADELRKSATYTGQEFVSTWLSKTKVRERQRGPKIQPSQLEKMRALLKPGDILLERQDWYLSRALMPGYWAHAAIYVGDGNDLEALGLQEHEWIAGHFEQFKAPDSSGHIHNILEAVPEGVRMTTLEHCIGNADSAAILRPVNLTKAQAKEVVARAFRHLDKPYDFEFDFFSADKLVCTELVYRAFSELEKADQFQFPLVNVLGRETLPPTELARKFAREVGSPHPQLELILFLDGHAHEENAKISNSAEFSKTADRPALTWLNEL